MNSTYQNVTDDDITAMQERNAQRVQDVIAKLGKAYMHHPDNHVQRKDKEIYNYAC